jgi:hypothetical protein
MIGSFSPIVDELLGEIDDRLALLLPLIEAGQEGYISQNGIYFQGPVTHSAVPADGAEAAPDRLEYHLSDQVATWLDVAGGRFPATTMSAIEVHQSVGPDGPGWRAIVRTRIAGRLYQRVVGYGADMRLTRGWHEVVEEPV